MRYILYKYWLRILMIVLFLPPALNGKSQVQPEAKRSVSKRSASPAEMLLDSAAVVSSQAPQRSFDYMERALELSIRNHDRTGEARCYLMLGNANSGLKQYDLALDYYNKALLMTGDLDVSSKLELYRKMGESYEKTANYSKSIDLYNKGIILARTGKLVQNEIDIRYDLAQLYLAEGDHDKALRQYNAILKLEEARNNRAGEIDVNNKIGELYLMQEKPSAAISSYQKSVAVAREANDQDKESSSLRNLSNAYRQSKQYDQELEARKLSLQLSKKANKVDEQAEDNLAIGSSYIEQQKPERAVPYIQQSIELASKTGDVKQKGAAYKKLSEAYKESGKYDKALQAYQEYAALVDTINNRRERELKKNMAVVAEVNRKLQRIDMLEKDFEVNRKTMVLLQREKELNAKELRNQKRITWTLVLVILVLTLSSFLVYRSSREKRKANMLLALKSLRSQMNPHFIFNSLNSVNSFIAQNDERKANKYLSDFAQLMRAVLENSKYEFVSLASEIDIISLYLKLEHFRFSDKFDYTLKIDDDIRGLEIEIPPMLIQPYIENAIWHGLRYKEEKGFLNVEVLRKNDYLLVTVSDNGIGRKHSQELKTKHQRESSSTGLRNTLGRLDIINEIYRTRFSVNIEDMDKENATGTVVELKIPFIYGTKRDK